MFPNKISELHARNSKLSSANLTLMHPKESMLHLSLTPHSTSPISCQGVSNAAYTSRIKKDRPLALRTCYLEKKNFKKRRKTKHHSPKKPNQTKKTNKPQNANKQTNKTKRKTPHKTKNKQEKRKGQIPEAQRKKKSNTNITLASPAERK